MKHLKLETLEQTSNDPKRLVTMMLAILFVGVGVGSLMGLPQYRLVGASVSSDGSSVAILENTKQNKQEVYGLNDTAFGEAKVVKIEDGKVTLSYQGKLITLQQQGTNLKQAEQQNTKTDEESNHTINSVVSQLMEGVSPENIYVRGQKGEPVDLGSLALPVISEEIAKASLIHNN